MRYSVCALGGADFMSYEVFERKTVRKGSPMMSFSKIGQIVFNQSASAILQKETIETVLALWDKSTKKLALKSTSNKKDPRSYTIRFNPNGNGASFSCKTFLDYIGIDQTERKALSVEINPDNEYFVEVAIPEEFFKKGTVQRMPIRNTAS
jgi:hypothetical protein